MKYFKIIKLVFNVSSDISGVQVLICGKFNGGNQTQIKYFKYGMGVKTNTFSSLVKYAFASAITYTGSFGVHVWFIKM